MTPNSTSPVLCPQFEEQTPDCAGFEFGLEFDVELETCLRETALSLQLPAPGSAGRADMMFTIPLGGAAP